MREMAIKKSQQLIDTCLQSDKFRFDDKAFTRERSLGAKKMLLYRIYHSFADMTSNLPADDQALPSFITA